MQSLTTTFVIPEALRAGMLTGHYERVGGIVREVGSKKIVAWLREVPKLGESWQDVQGILQITSAASILNLGITVIGFAVIMHRLNELEQRLQKAQELLSKVNRKIDLGFYAKFQAALELAKNALTMSKPENRRNSALSAITLFLEAEHIYTDYVDQELDQKIQVTDGYLLTLSLAYLAEVRCYLELEEWETALHRLQEGAVKIQPRLRHYIELLLTSNPAAYLNPHLKGQIDLRRLTRVYQWLDPALDENAVFEGLRENLFNWTNEQGEKSGYKWVNALPAVITNGMEVKGDSFNKRKETRQEAMNRLLQMMEVMESMIETNQRFVGYQTEIKAIAKLGLSFQEWTNLLPTDEAAPEHADMIYIIPAEPIAV